MESEQYEQFSDHRLRPGLDLIARIPAIDPSRVIDLGCGTGALTAILAQRWPTAHIVGLDASRDMLAHVPSGIENVECQGPHHGQGSSPADYRLWLGGSVEIDMWVTTYHQVLCGADPYSNG